MTLHSGVLCSHCESVVPALDRCRLADASRPSHRQRKNQPRILTRSFTFDTGPAKDRVPTSYVEIWMLAVKIMER